MKIAVVFDGLQTGGIERVGIDYIRLLASKGNEITVFNLIPDLNAMEQELPKECKIKHFYFSRKMAPEIYTKLIKKNIFCKLLFPIAYFCALLFDFLYKPFTRMKSEKYDIAIAFSGHYNDLTFVSYDFVKSDKKVCWLHGALYGYAIISDGFLTLYNKIRNLVVLSDVFQYDVLYTNKQLNLNIKKIYNPSYISDRQVDEKKVNELRDKYGEFVLMVGRLAPDKDQLTLIKALEYLRAKYNFNKKLVLVGDGIKRRELETYVVERGLSDAVVFEGNRFDVQNYYSAAHLFAHSSPLEGLPTTLIESLYFELPIVATDSAPGVREILGNNDYGLVVPVNSLEQMAENIYRMFTDEGLYNNYKRLSKKKFSEFMPDTIEKSITEFLGAL